METVLPVYTVYYDPLDYPGRYVVRRWNVTAGAPRPEKTPLYVGDSLERARSLIPLGLICFTADDGDDPAVLESWM